MSENEERRLRQMQNIDQFLRAKELRHQAADKRRRELSDETKTKFLTNEQKREQAEQRRREKFIAEKTKAKAERRKRDLVKARKSYLVHKMSDIMSFLNNSESLWEFVGMEKDW